jgi:Tfp pilus assembly protein PilF
LARHRNLGKAFYENPTTQAQAVDEFKKALALAHNSDRERLNYGLALLRAGKTKEGMTEIEAVQKRDPKLPHTYFNLGIELKKLGDHERALAQFQKFVELVPAEPISRYNLGVMLKLAGKTPEAIVEFERAAKLDTNLAAARFQLFNAYRTSGRAADAQKALAEFQRLKKDAEGAAVPEDVDWSAYSEILDPVPPPLAPFREVELKFEDKILAEGATGAVIVDGQVTWWNKTAVSGVAGLTDIVSVAAADYNNDGVTDLAVVTGSGVSLVRAGKVETTLPGRYNDAVWLDYDHDYDLDLFLLGAQPKLYRNQGTAGFVDRTADFPFAAGEAVEGIAYRFVPDTRATDLAVSYRGRAGTLYRDLLSGKFSAEPAPFVAAGATKLIAADSNADGKYEVLSSATAKAPLAADPDNSGLVRANLQDKILPGATLFLTADLDKDGREDYVALDAQGRLHRLLNRTVTPNRFIRIKLTGVKNLKLSPFAEIEVKAGGLYQKKVYRGTPLVFGLRNFTQVDTVRITWPNGLIQNEPNQPAGREYDYKEAQRLSGSCPIIWTWDGDGFRYITDVLGVAPLGAAAGDGKYFETDHDEYVFIPGEALKERNGSLEVRLTEELSEVAYIDQIQLLAVDHPADTPVYSNDKWKSPPYPEFRLWGAKQRLEPVAAHDGDGRDVRAKLLKADRTYPDDFPRTMSNLAPMHTLTLKFPDSTPAHAAMMMAGWVDWADGSTFLSAAQEDPQGLVPPVLQARNAAGEWVTIQQDMGMPAGKPKSIVVDVHFPSHYRELRIVTNLCVYWDEIFLSPDTAAPAATITRLTASDAQLNFRGFSANKVHPERKQPEEFFYPNPDPVSLWNPTPGRYTRYGAVDSLLKEADDRMALMGSGDEIRLLFNARTLPALKTGWKRDYLLLVDGWAKDRDANTAHSQNVDPLPFHRMSGYPLGKQESHPDGEYRQQFNTRPGLRLIRPLVPAGGLE